MTYQVMIPADCAEKTDRAIAAFLAANPHCIVDDAIDAIFQTGVAVFNAVSDDSAEVCHENLYP